MAKMKKKKREFRMWVLLRKRDGRPILLIQSDDTQVVGFSRKKDLIKNVGTINDDEEVAMLRIPF
jgi:hypothetical protein